MNIWEAKYKALCMAVNNESYIKNAEKLVESAIQMSRACGMPFDEAVWAILKTTGLIQTQSEPIQSLSEAFKKEHWITIFIRKLFKGGA